MLVCQKLHIWCKVRLFNCKLKSSQYFNYKVDVDFFFYLLIDQRSMILGYFIKMFFTFHPIKTNNGEN